MKTKIYNPFVLNMLNAMNNKTTRSQFSIILFVILIYSNAFAQVPAVPNTTFTIGASCIYTKVTRHSEPPAGVDWYWITSPTSTSPLSVYPLASINSSTNLYLRARSNSGNYAWSTGAQFVGYIEVINRPCGSVELSGPTVVKVGDQATYQAIFRDADGSVVAPPYYGMSPPEWTGFPTDPEFISTAEYSSEVHWNQSGTFALNYLFSSDDPNFLSVSNNLYVTVNDIYPAPLVTVTNNGIISSGSPVTLAVGNYVYDTYQWVNKNGSVIPGATTSTYTTNVPGRYKVRVTKATSTQTSGPKTIVNASSIPDMNYVQSNTILTEGITNVASVDALSEFSKSQSTQYFDGLGRLVQTVNKKESPLTQDIVQPVTYDALGRQTKIYLPYVDGNDGNYKITAMKDPGETSIPEGSQYTIGSQYAFYQVGGDLAADRFPFSETVLEASPLNRPLKKIGPGESWYNGNKYEVFNDLTNVHGSALNQEKVIAWTINTSGILERNTAVIAGVEPGYYPTGSLLVKSTKDENLNEVREYTDKIGHVVLKKVYVAGSKTDFSILGNWAETYYVYDHYGNLVVVLPPEATKNLN